MTKANYGTYGSLKAYTALGITASLSLILGIFTEYLRALFMTIFFASSGLLLSVSTILPVIYGSRRISLVPEIVAAGTIDSKDRVLDIGTGRGFPAIEIAKAVPSSRVVGVDVWDKPAKGQLHKGFIIGNSKEKAEVNALLEEVQDRVEFKQCDARDMPFESESFDVVVSFTAMHQMVYFSRNGDQVLKEIHRVLRPGGRLVDVDVMVGEQLIEKLRELGFREIKLRNLTGFPSFLKILSATKGQQTLLEQSIY